MYPMRDSTPTGSATGSRPKTRTEPLSALSSPRMWRMSVVLPAPLTPTRPYTAPRGSDSLTESSAVRVPKRRVRSKTWMTGSPMCVYTNEAQDRQQRAAVTDRRAPCLDAHLRFRGGADHIAVVDHGAVHDQVGSALLHR